MFFRIRVLTEGNSWIKLLTLVLPSRLVNYRYMSVLSNSHYDSAWSLIFTKIISRWLVHSIRKYRFRTLLKVGREASDDIMVSRRPISFLVISNQVWIDRQQHPSCLIKLMVILAKRLKNLLESHLKLASQTKMGCRLGLGMC